MNATIGLMRALFVYERSLVKIGTAAFKSRNLKSMPIITFEPTSAAPSSSVFASDGALNGGLASSRWPGMRSGANVEAEAEEMASASSTMRVLRGVPSAEGLRGNLMSTTASSLPEVSQ